MKISRYKLALVTILTVLFQTVVAFSDASATKAAPQLPVQLTASAAMVKQGGAFLMYVHIPNKSASSYWGVSTQIDFPEGIRCDAITSQTVSRGHAAGGCTITRDALGRGKKLSCYYSDVYDWQVFDITVSCTVEPTAQCPAALTNVANLSVHTPGQASTSSAVVNVMCLATPTPPSTPTPPPTATASPSPTFVATSTPYPTATPTFIPTYTSTPYPISTPIIAATPTPSCSVTPGVECSDGIDNDHDGKIDFPNDPGCTSPHDPTEGSPVLQIEESVASVITIGSEVVFNYVVRNVGNTTARNVKIDSVFTNGSTSASIGAVLTFLRSSGEISNCSFVQSEQGVICTIAELPVGGDVVFSLSYSVPADCSACNATVYNRTDASVPESAAFATANTNLQCGAVHTPTPYAHYTATPAPHVTPVAGYTPTPTSSQSSSCETYSVLRRISGSYRGTPITIRESSAVLVDGSTLPCASQLTGDNGAQCLTYADFSTANAAVQSDLRALSAGGQCFGMSKLTYALLSQACDIDEDSFECEQFLALSTIRSNLLPLPESTSGVSLSREHNARFQVIVFDKNCKLIVDPSDDQESNSCPAATITGNLYSGGRRK